MPLSRSDLQAIVRDGLVADIFRADRAIALMRTISHRSAQVNEGQGNFGELFGALQSILTTEATLSVARLYDKPNKRYPTRCVEGVLHFLSEHKSELPEVREPYQLVLALEAMTAPADLIGAVKATPAEFAARFAAFVAGLLSSADRIEELERLKELRDKSLAHSEYIAEVRGPTWEGLVDLNDLAKHVVGVLGWAYFDIAMAYTVDGEYLLTSDAKRPSLALTRLLDKLYGKFATD